MRTDLGPAISLPGGMPGAARLPREDSTMAADLEPEGISIPQGEVAPPALFAPARDRADTQLYRLQAAKRKLCGRFCAGSERGHELRQAWPGG